ncbi:MAG: FAD-dependent oxidoreductase [Woeseia sp.]
MSASALRNSGIFSGHKIVKPTVVRPTTFRDIQDYLDPSSNYLDPFRPMGAGSSSTDCSAASAGTVIDMTGMDRIIKIDAYSDTVTVQAGVRLHSLVDALAESGLELAGNFDLMNRTVGGAVASGCIGPSMKNDGALFARQAISMKAITPAGKLLDITHKKKSILYAYRLSYGMLGIICIVTLKVRPIRPFSASHRRCTIDQLAASAGKLATANVGLKFYMLPFRDRVYLDLRSYSPETRSAYSIPWKLKDWGESTVLPNVFKSLSRIVPISGVRYRLIDGISEATQGLVNNRLVSTGDNSATQSVRANRSQGSNPLQYSTWCFPATDFAIVAQSYRDFCRDTYHRTRFRCDMPTVGFLLPRDRSALLSPTFDEPMMALRAVSTPSRGWEDFVIDFAEFAQHWGGSPFLNQTRSMSLDYAQQAFGSRINFFKRIRRQLDPANRMMNPFLSQYFL